VRPKLVVCDEPVSALDVSIQAQIVGLLKRLQHETGMALIFISHDLSVVRYLCHRVMVLYLGRKMEEADRTSLFSAPQHPYTQALIAAVPIADPEVAKAHPPAVLSGDLPSPLHPPSGCVFRTRCPKAQDLCAAEVPAWRKPLPGRGVACHFPGS
jgi:oligopeptide transport system ATP-binding protein